MITIKFSLAIIIIRGKDWRLWSIFWATLKRTNRYCQFTKQKVRSSLNSWVFRRYSLRFPFTDSDIIRLPEDTALVGFTPLETKPVELVYCHKSDDIEAVQTTLRIKKILFFGKNFLCKTDPPVLKKVEHATHIEYTCTNVQTNSIEVILLFVV